MELNRQETYNQAAKIVAEKLRIGIDKVVPQATLHELRADSLDMVEIIMQLEEHFAIEIDDQKLESLECVSEVVDYIQQLREAKN
jgi:acyl carrier protein